MVTWEEVQAAMDIYQTDNIKGDDILKNQCRNCKKAKQKRIDNPK